MSEPAAVQVAVLGIRHHGPGSARSLLAALGDFGPDQVLIEGPADADPLVGWDGARSARLGAAVLQPVLNAIRARK